MAEKDNGVNKFIYIVEFVYAILLSWGFARASERFMVHYLFYWLCMLVSLLTLIRFFFAPSHNVGALVYSLPMNIVNARKIIFLDIPIMIAHSLLYYRMCYNASMQLYDLFYFDLMILLILNAAWLFWIRKRIEYCKKSVPAKFSFWIGNNLVFAALLGISQVSFHARPFFSGKSLFNPEIYFWASFTLAILNCVIDLSSCALEYFEDV